MNQNQSNISYIYGLYSSEEPEVIRYIGYSKNPIKRLKDHLSDSKYLKTYKHKWIQSELKKGNKLYIIPLRCVAEEDQYKCEIETILLFKSIGAPLTNGNNGGLGGKSPTVETRAKMSTGKIGNTWNKGRIPLNIKTLRESNKKPRTEQAKLNMSLARKGMRMKKRVLSDDIIIDIFKSYNSGLSISQVINKLNIKKHTFSNVLYVDRMYSDVKKKYNLKITREPFKNQFDKRIKPE